MTKKLNLRVLCELCVKHFPRNFIRRNGNGRGDIHGQANAKTWDMHREISRIQEFLAYAVFF